MVANIELKKALQNIHQNQFIGFSQYLTQMISH